MEYFLHDRIFQNTVRLRTVRTVIGGHCVRELSVGIHSRTSVVVMCHRDIQNQWVRRITLSSPWQDNVILDLHVYTFIDYIWDDFVDFNPVTNRS